MQVNLFIYKVIYSLGAYLIKYAKGKAYVNVKCLPDVFVIGVGCIFPFLPVHMLSAGLTRGQARLISAVAPCVALLGPAILGYLIDKLVFILFTDVGLATATIKYIEAARVSKTA